MDGQTDRSRADLTLAGEPDGAGVVVRLAGELDMATAADLAVPLEGLLARPPQPVVLELGELSFLDSSGVAVLIRIANRFPQLETRNATPPVRRVIEVLGLAGRLGLGEA
jgi:anti-sigma B factor antagonist